MTIQQKEIVHRAQKYHIQAKVHHFSCPVYRYLLVYQVLQYSIPCSRTPPMAPTFSVFPPQMEMQNEK